MTQINNGDRQTLFVPGVFSGLCGVSRGLIAFVPMQQGLKLPAALPARFSGRDVVLSEITKSEDGRSYTARVLG